MLNEVFGGMRIVLFVSGMFPCVCVPTACVNSGEYCHSRLSELVSPRRDCLRLAQVLLECLAQAEGSCFERRMVLLRRE